MNESRPPEDKKVRAAHAAIVPFVPALAIMLLLLYTDLEVGKAFVAITFGASVVLAVLLFAVIASGRERRP